MKKINLIVLFLACSIVSFGQNFDSFGVKIKPSKAKQISVLTQDNSQENKTVKVEAEVESVCQAAGCWMKVKLDNGKTMRVTFKDYGFFVPKDLSGTKVIFEGIPSIKTTSVEEQKHYAEDAGKSKEEIAKISEPKVELTFVAAGVLVPKK